MNQPDLFPWDALVNVAAAAAVIFTVILFLKAMKEQRLEFAEMLREQREECIKERAEAREATREAMTDITTNVRLLADRLEDR